jgi:hypothetical protein
MIFEDVEQLQHFMKRLRDTILLDREKGIEKAEKLIVFREKLNSKKQELFFDLLVYGRNRCMRLPWSTKVAQQRPLIPVQEGVIRRVRYRTNSTLIISYRIK